MKSPRLDILGKQDREALAVFLAEPARPGGTLTYEQLRGFLFVIAVAPELILPSDWLDEVFAGESAGFETEEEARTVLGRVMALYNETVHRIRERSIAGGAVRVGRNDPCPCGSGKKYRKCCLPRQIN